MKKKGSKDPKLSKSGSGKKLKKSAQGSVKKQSLNKKQQNVQSAPQLTPQLTPQVIPQVIPHVYTQNTQQMNQLGSQQSSQVGTNLLNQSYQSQQATQSYLPSGSLYTTQYQIPQYQVPQVQVPQSIPTQTTQQWSVTPQTQLSQASILNQNTLYNNNNLLNQAVSFQTPQPFYTAQVPQVSLQYSGYPSTNIQNQLNLNSNPKPTIPTLTTSEKIACK